MHELKHDRMKHGRADESRPRGRRRICTEHVLAAVVPDHCLVAGPGGIITDLLDSLRVNHPCYVPLNKSALLSILLVRVDDT